MTDALDHVHHTRQIYDASDLGRSLLRAASAAAALALLGGTTVGIALFQAPSEAAARDVLHLGTAAIWDVPATGDAGPGQVVRWDDSRLTDARTPLAHGHATADILGLGYYATGTDASYLTGTLADARLSSNVALKNADNAFSVAQTIAGSAPSSVSSGQVAIGGGTIRAAGNINAGNVGTGTNAITLGGGTGSGEGGYFVLVNGGSARAYIGNVSAVIGGSYSEDLAIYTTGHTRFYGEAPTDVNADEVRVGGGELWTRGQAVIGKGGGLLLVYGTAPSSVSSGEVRIGGGALRAYANIYAHTGIVCPNYGNTSWQLGGYIATAPSATGYVTIKIDGTVYKLLAST